MVRKKLEWSHDCDSLLKAPNIYLSYVHKKLSKFGDLLSIWLSSLDCNDTRLASQPLDSTQPFLLACIKTSHFKLAAGS